jgi:hypothetical protein
VPWPPLSSVACSWITLIVGSAILSNTCILLLGYCPKLRHPRGCNRGRAQRPGSQSFGGEEFGGGHACVGYLGFRRMPGASLSRCRANRILGPPWSYFGKPSRAITGVRDDELGADRELVSVSISIR